MRLLIVEDSEDDALLTVEILRSSGFEDLDWTRVDNRDALDAAVDASPDAIVADYNVPGLDVRETLRLCLASVPDAPLLIVSGTMDAEVGVELMHLGAQDYLDKAHLERLPAALQRGLAVASERERARTNERRYRDMFESLAVGVVRELPDGSVLDVNPALLRMLGLANADEYRRRGGLIPIGHPDEEGRALLRSAYSTSGDPRGIEILVPRKDGVMRWLRVYISADHDESGVVAGLEIVVTDVDERIRDKHELEHVAAELRHSNEVRQGLLDRLITAQEEERHRIAVEIHDDAVQVMTAASIHLATLANTTEDNSLRQELNSLIETVSLSTRRLRSLLFDLQPPGLRRHGLVDAIGLLLDSFRQTSGIQHTICSELEYEPPPERSTLIYRIVQEALANVRKHSRATWVHLAITDAHGAIEVTISDNGVGFIEDEADDEPGHLGLSSMRERALMAGGTLTIASVRGTGTTVVARVPTGPRALRVPAAV